MSSLNEAVALELIGLAGATQQSFATRFSVNDGPEVLRLAIEFPNDEWDEDNFETDGVLYKAESTGDYSYRGDEPEAYDEVFDQESDTDRKNLRPLTDFLKFINTSGDAAFAADLAEHLDVDAFARYLALQELVANFDDIDGPGNNSYLRYDEPTKRFTVMSWDMTWPSAGRPVGWGAPPAPGAAAHPRRAHPAGSHPPAEQLADPAAGREDGPTSWSSASRPTPRSPPWWSRRRPTSRPQCSPAVRRRRSSTGWLGCSRPRRPTWSMWPLSTGRRRPSASKSTEGPGTLRSTKRPAMRGTVG